ncbi:autotransporter assembly complex protein TamA [Cognatishimia maritima]|uniref:Autotransporter secretion outer membrane protein TamA n=1 Tax=Cognatishimia maritima TaxID=870908 RepID=A0A1M5L804_9RHOB|nr:autotransporter assembly complex family protein [Cognatishimia maritima]SHG61232.1 autotransporter secretion outer membrane protein TamA [Cognatishimia maritima]
MTIVAPVKSRLCRLLLVAMVLPSALGAFEFKMGTPGAPESLSDDLRATSLVAGLRSDKDAQPIDVLAAARSDYQRLLAVLYDAGYYGPVISIRVDGKEAADMSPLRVPQSIGRIDIQVTPGKAFRFSEAKIAPRAPQSTPPEGYAKGKRARAGVIREAVDTAISDWRDIGHAKAAVSSQMLTANHARAQMLADIRLSPGPQLRFGKLILPPEGNVRSERIREIAGIPSGQMFSPTELRRTGQRLRRTGTFRSVVVKEAEVPNADGTLDIELELVEAKPRRFGLGAELGSIEGLSLSGFWMHRNLLGGAERLRFDAEVSGISGQTGGIDYLLGARFDRPATFNPDTTFYLESRLEREDEPDYLENSALLEAGLTRVLNDEFSGSIAVAYSYSDITDDLGERQLTYLQLPTVLTYDNRDEELDATKGYFAEVELTPFFEFNSSSTGARLYADTRGYFSPGQSDRLTAALRFQIGTVVGADITDIAPNMLFFSGGAGTVRGQPYQSLAVDLGGGTMVGGRSFLGASAEVRTKVSDSWSVVAFSDAGYVGEDSFGNGDGDWHFGAGLGVRYHTSLGPIRLDIAAPVGSNAGNNVEFYIGIGQAF